MGVLKDLDEEILCGLSEEGEIESKLKIEDVSDHSRSSLATTATRVQNITRLPKLSLQSFSGNPLRVPEFLGQL